VSTRLKHADDPPDPAGAQHGATPDAVARRSGGRRRGQRQAFWLPGDEKRREASQAFGLAARPPETGGHDTRLPVLYSVLPVMRESRDELLRRELGSRGPLEWSARSRPTMLEALLRKLPARPKTDGEEGLPELSSV